MRRALQYQRLAGGVLALHEEDAALSGPGVMHEGAVSAQLGLAGIPAVSESTMIERDAALARYEDGSIHILHLSARESVEALAAAKAQGIKITGEVTPHHLTLTDEAVRSLDANFKMNPPLAGRAGSPGADRGAARRHDRLHRDRSRAAHPRGEGDAVRARADGRDRPGDGLRGALHRPGAARHAAAGADRRAHDLPAARSSACRRRRWRPARRPTSAWSISTPSGPSARPATRAARPTRASPAARCAARCG